MRSLILLILIQKLTLSIVILLIVSKQYKFIIDNLNHMNSEQFNILVNKLEKLQKEREKEDDHPDHPLPH